MSTYAQVSGCCDRRVLGEVTPENQLQDLLDLAERDVDRIMPKVDDLTDMIEGISTSGVTGGVWVASSCSSPRATLQRAPRRLDRHPVRCGLAI